MGAAVSRCPWTAEQDAYLREVYPDLPNDDVARLMDGRFGTTRTRDSILNRANKLGLRKSADFKKPQPRSFWTPDKIEWFRAYVPGHHEAEISAEHERIYGTPLTTAQIGNAKHNLGVKSGTTGYRFGKGHAPWNKGMTWDEQGMSEDARARCAATQYKPGEVHIGPSRDRPIGYEREGADGYVYVKVRDSRISGIQDQSRGNYNENYRLKHHVVWEQANGVPVPPHTMIAFADRDRRNFDPDNLVAVPRSLRGIIAREGWAYHDRASLEACITLAQMNREVHRLRCHPRYCKGCGYEFTPRYPNQRTCDACLAARRES